MTLAPVRYLQKWSATLPGESGVPSQRLPSHVDAAARRAAARAATSRRAGIAPPEGGPAPPIVVPVAPPQPLLALSIPGLSPDAEPPRPPVRSVRGVECACGGARVCGVVRRLSLSRRRHGRSEVL